jgi:hypothetical protein
MRQMKALVAIAAALLTCWLPTEANARWCALTSPAVQPSGSGATITVTIHCEDARTGNLVQYPDKTLYVGATIVKEPPEFQRDVVPQTSGDWSSDQYFDLKVVEVSQAQLANDVKVSFAAADFSSYTHLVMAVWDTKESCETRYLPDEEKGNGCRLYGFVLRDVDEEEYPAPIDAWPRPVCNVSVLKQAGFFKRGKDIMNMSRRLQGLAKLNDCWNLVNRPGLGYSLSRWRLAPTATLPPAQ